ncbi:MAG TPA: glycosyltransferase family 39 protein [Candidatus Saccharimonadales bacterium]|nr:glycosyltransferase family 39 protein [Candidatus Saccharimonadales bacterium]
MKRLYLLCKQNNKILLLFAAIVLLVLFVNLALPKVPVTPEENIREFYLTRIEKYGMSGLLYNEPANSINDTELVKPRNTVVGVGGRIAPSDFLGIYTYLYPLILPFLLLKNTAIAFSLFFLLGLIGIFCLTLQVFNKTTAFVATGLTATFPAFLYWQGRIMTDIPSLAFIVLGMSFYILAIRRRERAYTLFGKKWTGYPMKVLLTSAALMAVGVSVKYTNAILVVMFLLFFLPYKDIFTKRSAFFAHVAMLLVVVVLFLPILYLNMRLYGGLLTTGQALYSGQDAILRTADVSVADGFRKYFINFFGITSVLAIFAVVYKLKNKDWLRLKFSGFAVAYSTIIFLYFSRAADVYGASAKDVLLSYSQVRYFMPIFALLIVMSSYFFWYAKQKRMVGTMTVLALCLVFVVNTMNYKGVGINAVYAEGLQLEDQRIFILNNTPKNAYVFTSLSDKIIFPDRKVVTYYNAGKDTLPVRVDNTAGLAEKLYVDHAPIYFMWETVSPSVASERGYGKFSDYSRAFLAKGLHLRYIGQDLYKVEAVNGS